MKFFLKSVQQDKVKWMKVLIKVKLNNLAEYHSHRDNQKKCHQRVCNPKFKALTRNQLSLCR
jgi:hypothetical protein